MQVIIKPIPEKKAWHGKNGKESFARPHSIEVLLDSQTGRYATGLTPKDIEYLRETHNINLDLSDTFHPEKPHPYWGSNGAKIKLPNHTMILNDDRPLDFIKIKNLKASKFVADSLKAFEDGEFPEATHIIYDEKEEVEAKASKIAKKNKAIGIVNKLSKDEKISFVRLLSNEGTAGRSDDFISVKMDEIVNDSEKVDQFLSLLRLDKAEVSVRASIAEGLYNRVLTKEGSAIYYMGEKLGFDLEDTVNYFTDPNNQLTKVAFLEKLAAKSL